MLFRNAFTCGLYSSAGTSDVTGHDATCSDLDPRVVAIVGKLERGLPMAGAQPGSIEMGSQLASLDLTHVLCECQPKPTLDIV